MVIRDRDIQILRTYEGHDEGGDGTVPSVSATPIELSNQDREIYVRERHASLQNADHSLDQMIGLLRRQVIDQTQRFAPGTGISLDLDDLYLAGEPVIFRAQPEVEWAVLTAMIENVDSGGRLASAQMKPSIDGGTTQSFRHCQRASTGSPSQAAAISTRSPICSLWSISAPT
jgi:hypothetical protein